jgi:hypothetical protein
MRLEMEGNEGLFLFTCSIAALARRMAGEGRGLCRFRLEWWVGNSANAIAFLERIWYGATKEIIQCQM